MINTREKHELPGVEPGTSGLLDVGCPTEPYTPIYIYPIYIYILYVCVYKCLYIIGYIGEDSEKSACQTESEDGAGFWKDCPTSVCILEEMQQYSTNLYH